MAQEYVGIRAGERFNRVKNKTVSQSTRTLFRLSICQFRDKAIWLEAAVKETKIGLPMEFVQ